MEPLQSYRDVYSIQGAIQKGLAGVEIRLFCMLVLMVILSNFSTFQGYYNVKSSDLN